jgi:hypothetical protein
MFGASEYTKTTPPKRCYIGVDPIYNTIFPIIFPIISHSFG